MCAPYSLSLPTITPLVTPPSSSTNPPQSQEEPERKEPRSKPILPPHIKISLINTSSLLFHHIPDVGLDRLLVSSGEPIGTSGVATCFAICSIGISQTGSTVLGLCHTSGCLQFKTALHLLKSAMVHQQGAKARTIVTYVIGGQRPVRRLDYPGTLATERKIIRMAKTEKIKGVLFNKTLGEREDSVLNVVLTSHDIYASHDLLFEITGEEDGTTL